MGVTIREMLGCEIELERGWKLELERLGLRNREILGNRIRESDLELELERA